MLGISFWRTLQIVLNLTIYYAMHVKTHEVNMLDKLWLRSYILAENWLPYLGLPLFMLVVYI